MVIVALALLLAQDGVNEVKVQLAIQKGIEYLRTAPSPDFKGAYGNSDELLLLTFLHAGVKADDPKVQEFFKGMIDADLKRTYKVSLQAMCLEKLDPERYQARIALCAQFLVDNQAKNGQWAYGNMTESTQKKVAAPPPVVAPEPPPGKPAPKPKLPKISIVRAGDGFETGDNSNSQYAALGLRACHDANVHVPKEAIERAIKGWKETNYGTARKGKSVASGGKPEGWGYKAPGEDERGVYWAMSAGAAGSLVIHHYLAGRKWKDDALVKSAFEWMSANFKVDPQDAYGLYALERAGILYGTESIGPHRWYPAGAGALINSQQPDGSWGRDTEEWHGKVWDTCFAILFLRKATRPLVASGVAPR